MLTVTLYSRADCHLCDEARHDLGTLQTEFPHRLVEVDIETDPVLQKKFLEKIPVIDVGPYRLSAPITMQSLRMTIGAAQDRRSQLQEVGDPRYLERVEKGRTVARGDRLSLWLSKHYLFLLNFVMLLYVGLPFLAPALMEQGNTGAARLLYRLYSPLCHQFAFRSFFMFGQQPYYPLAEAGVSGVVSFEEATRIVGATDPTNSARLEARAFVGDEALGYKVALCERDVAIYGAILAFGLFFGATGRRVHSLHWLTWIVLGMVPIAADGVSQVLSQLQWPWLAQVLPYRESTPQLRVLTGALFGALTAWYAYPNIEASMQETRSFLIKKFAVSRPTA